MANGSPDRQPVPVGLTTVVGGVVLGGMVVTGWVVGGVVTGGRVVVVVGATVVVVGLAFGIRVVGVTAATFFLLLLPPPPAMPITVRRTKATSDQATTRSGTRTRTGTVRSRRRATWPRGSTAFGYTAQAVAAWTGSW